MRFGANTLQANAQGAGFGGSIGAGASGFADGLQQGQEMQMKRALFAQRQAEAEREKQYGVKSSGFEGDIARAQVILSDPNATEQDRRIAQSVIATAERLTGSYDPVTGIHRYDPKSRLGGSAPSMLPTSAPAAPSKTPSAPMTILNSVPGEILPPPSGVGTPDASVFTGNPKVDAALQQKAGETAMDTRAGKTRAVQEGLAKVDTDTFASIASQTQQLSNMVPDLERIERAAANSGTGGIATAKLKLGQMLGIEYDGKDDAELINSLQSKLAPSMRTPGSGSSSDRDVQMFIDSLPNLMTSEAGIKKMVGGYKAILARKKQEEKIGRDLLRGEEGLDRFYQETEKLGPVFGDDYFAIGSAPAVDRKALIERLRGR